MILIKNGYLIDPETETEGHYDLLVKDGKIARIATALSVSEEADKLEIIDATDCIVAPGLVDVHVHFRDPGYTHKEDIITGAQAAAKGGFTTVVLMANTNPPVDNAETLHYVLEKGKETAIHIETCAAITRGLNGQELTDLEELHAQGAAGFTDDGIPIMDVQLVEEAMVRARKLGVPLSFHEENPDLIGDNGVNDQIAQRHFGLKGSPREAEVDLVERDLQIALRTGAIINVQHISSKEAVELVRQAKKQGGNIHAEVTPHHFSLTEDILPEKGTLAKMNPPLREETDRQAVIGGLRDGTIDLIATDHAPHSKEEKEQPITRAPSGIIGLETALSLGVMNLVEKGYLSHKELNRKMSYNPAKLYHLPAGTIEEGACADIVIYHPKESWVAEGFLSKSSNTPFAGEILQGVVHYTICNGNIVYRNSLK